MRQKIDETSEVQISVVNCGVKEVRVIDVRFILEKKN